HQLGDVVDPTEDRRTAHAQAHLGNVVVHKARDGRVEVRPTLDLVEQPDAGGAGAHDEGNRLDAPGGRALVALAPDADGEAGARPGTDAHKRQAPGGGALVALAPDGEGEACARHGTDAQNRVQQDDGTGEVLEPAQVDERHQKEHRADQVAADDVLDVAHADVLPRAGEEIGDPEG